MRMLFSVARCFFERQLLIVRKIVINMPYIWLTVHRENSRINKLTVLSKLFSARIHNNKVQFGYCNQYVSKWWIWDEGENEPIYFYHFYYFFKIFSSLQRFSNKNYYVYEKMRCSTESKKNSNLSQFSESF